MICLVIKLTARYDDIIKSALQMVKIFYENRNNITIIITNSENITIVQEAEISKSLENKCKINPTHILFTSKKMSAEELRNKLNIIKKDMSNIETIKLKDRDLLNTVGNDGDIDVIEEREAFLKEFKESLEKFKTEYNSSSESALKFALYFAFVDYKEQLIERFSEIVKKKVTDTDTAIVEIITFNNEIFVDFNSFSKQVQTGLKAEFANYDNGDNNNRYKKCPHCNTIWFKVKGCNSMPCGRRTKLKDIFMGRFKNYIVKFIKGKIEVLTNEKTKEMDAGTDSEFVGLTEEEKQFNEGNREGKSKIYPQGCGASLDWTQMEDVTDEINKKVTEISLDNYDNKVKEKIESVKIDIFQ
jgi:hypothetical protein